MRLTCGRHPFGAPAKPASCGAAMPHLVEPKAPHRCSTPLIKQNAPDGAICFIGGGSSLVLTRLSNIP